MTELQARPIAGRAVRAAQAQEDFARRLRPGGGGIPTQRISDADALAPEAPLTLVAGVSA